MKKLSQWLTVLCISAMTLAACSDSKNDEGGDENNPTTGMELTFKFNVKATDEGMELTVEPSDQTAYYICGYVPTWAADGGEDAAYDNLTDWVKAYLSEDIAGTLNDINDWTEALYQGNRTEIAELQADDYFLYAAGVAADSGELTTEVFSTQFTAVQGEGVPNDDDDDDENGEQLALTVKVLATTDSTVTYKVEANGYEGKYFCGVCNADEDVEAYIAKEIEMGSDSFFRDAFVQSLMSGDKTVTDEELEYSTDYTVFAVGLDEQTFEFSTEIALANFTTAAPEFEELSLKVAVEGYNIQFTASPTDMTYTWVLGLERFLKADSVEYNGDDEQFIADMIEWNGGQSQLPIVKGLYTIAVDKGYNADAEMYKGETWWLVVFGYDAKLGRTNGIYKNLNLVFKEKGEVMSNLTEDVVVEEFSTAYLFNGYEGTQSENGVWHRERGINNAKENSLWIDFMADSKNAPFSPGTYNVVDEDIAGCVHTGHYDSKGQKAGLWYYSNDGRMAAAVSGTVTVEDLGNNKNRLHAVFEDGIGHTVDFTWSGPLY